MGFLHLQQFRIFFFFLKEFTPWIGYFFKGTEERLHKKVFGSQLKNRIYERNSSLEAGNREFLRAHGGFLSPHSFSFSCVLYLHSCSVWSVSHNLLTSNLLSINYFSLLRNEPWTSLAKEKSCPNISEKIHICLRHEQLGICGGRMECDILVPLCPLTHSAIPQISAVWETDGNWHPLPRCPQ